jgi:hypothetical protein
MSDFYVRLGLKGRFVCARNSAIKVQSQRLTSMLYAVMCMTGRAEVCMRGCRWHDLNRNGGKVKDTVANAR